MPQLRFYAVAQLPNTLEPDSFYFVENGDYAESYLTSSNGTPRLVGNTLMIGEIIAEEAGNWGGSDRVTIVDDIPARDALASGVGTNLMVMVLDASADSTVDKGSAMYVYQLSADAWHKVSEYESMDLVLSWDTLQGRPASSPQEIDTSVEQAHEHANAAVLEKLDDTGGVLTYKGTPLRTPWETKDW